VLGIPMMIIQVKFLTPQKIYEIPAEEKLFMFQQEDFLQTIFKLDEHFKKVNFDIFFLWVFHLQHFTYLL
jgi:hypothetical protein